MINLIIVGAIFCIWLIFTSIMKVQDNLHINVKHPMIRSRIYAIKRGINSIPKYLYLIGALIGYIVFAHYFDGTLKPASQYNRDPSTLWMKLKKTEKLREIVCSRFANDCYAIVDETAYTDAIYRYLYSEHLGSNGFLTRSKVHYTKDGEKIDKATVIAPYTKAMIIGGYLTQSIGIPNKKESVLIIGLGGGAMNNFFTTVEHPPKVTVVEIDPTVVYIGAKWFDANTTHDQEILTEDAVTYLRHRTIPLNAKCFDEALNQHKCLFDTIIADASGTGKDTSWVAPIKEFFDPQVVEDLKRNLKPDGTVVVNVVSLDLTLKERILKKPYDLYSRFFKSCFYVKAAYNYILVCTDKEMNINSFPAYDELINRLPADIKNRLSPELGFQPFPLDEIDFIE